MTAPWRETVASFDAAFQATPLGVALVSAGEQSFGRFLHVNPALCRLTGYSADHLLSIGFQAITHPDDIERGVAIAQSAAHGELSGFEVEKRTSTPTAMSCGCVSSHRSSRTRAVRRHTS